MRTITLEGFHAELIAQGVSSHLHFALKCPMCGTIQSAKSLIRAGAGADFDAVEKYLGFSCVGRFSGTGGTPRKTPDGRPCNWTLGGLFQVHKLEVITPDGVHHARFEPATPEEAQALERSHAAARPKCFRSAPTNPAQRAENCCHDCLVERECFQPAAGKELS